MTTLMQALMQADPGRAAEGYLELLRLGDEMFAVQFHAVAAALAEYRAASTDATRGALWTAMAEAGEAIYETMESRPDVLAPALIDALAEAGEIFERLPEA